MRKLKKGRVVCFGLILLVTLTGCTAAGQSGLNSSQSNSVVQQYETDLFETDVLKIEITTTQEDWEYLIENAASKPWISGDVTIDGTVFENVGVKTKGNTSLTQVVQSDSDRYSLKMNFGKYEDGQTCYGLDRLVINNVYADSTYLKEYLSYHLFQYMEVPGSLCTFAEITVNGEHYGFFIALEDTNSSFFERNYGADNSIEAYKPESMGMNKDRTVQISDQEELPNFEEQPPDMANMPNREGGGGKKGMDGGSGGVSLVYTDDEIDSYSKIFDNEITKTDEEDHKRLIASLKEINEGENPEDYIDVDEVLRYTACNVFLMNLDSYFSGMGHNYVLAENKGVLSMIPWDYNLAFGSFQSANTNEIINFAIDTIFSGVEASERPIISKLFENEKNVEKYHQYLRQIAEDYVQSGVFEETLTMADTVIREYVKNDTTSFLGYDAYTEGIEVLKLYGSLRAESIIAQLDGTIPSTTEAQADCDTLIDTSDLDLSKLGTMNMGGDPRNRPAGEEAEPETQ